MENDWESIREEFGPLVWGIAMRITNHHADAVDCFQDVFVEIMRTKSAHEILDWAAYLRWLTTRRSIDCVRARRRRDCRAPSGDPDRIAVSKPLGEDIGFQELVTAVREELNRLPSHQAEAFWLICVERRTQAEVAKQMCVTPNHVGVLVHRARKHLKKTLRHLSPNGAASKSKETS